MALASGALCEISSKAYYNSVLSGDSPLVRLFHPGWNRWGVGGVVFRYYCNFKHLHALRPKGLGGLELLLVWLCSDACVSISLCPVLWFGRVDDAWVLCGSCVVRCLAWHIDVGSTGFFRSSCCSSSRQKRSQRLLAFFCWLFQRSGQKHVQFTSSWSVIIAWDTQRLLQLPKVWFICLGVPFAHFGSMIHSWWFVDRDNVTVFAQLRTDIAYLW